MPTLPQSRLPESGVYVVRIQVPRAMSLTVGALGPIRFEPGSYLYVGSAARGLPRRVARHFRREKPLRWHIDYLTAHAPATQAWAWPAQTVSECAVARALASCLTPFGAFGASDCRCRTHLFALPADAEHWPALAGLSAPPVSISSRSLRGATGSDACELPGAHRRP